MWSDQITHRISPLSIQSVQTWHIHDMDDSYGTRCFYLFYISSGTLNFFSPFLILRSDFFFFYFAFPPPPVASVTSLHPIVWLIPAQCFCCVRFISFIWQRFRLLTLFLTEKTSETEKSTNLLLDWITVDVNVLSPGRPSFRTVVTILSSSIPYSPFHNDSMVSIDSLSFWMRSASVG